MAANGRHYVTIDDKRRKLRRYLVIRTDIRPGRRGVVNKYVYTTVKRCWTFNGAISVARRLNAKKGHAH